MESVLRPHWANSFGIQRNFGYWCTPSNSITFATTGGDGVHYGLLDIGSGFNDESPVVMTVPAQRHSQYYRWR